MLPFNVRDLDGLGINLGQPGKGFAEALMRYANSVSGIATVAPSAATVVVQLDAALDDSPAFASIMTVDATAVAVASCTWGGPGANVGKLTITLGAAATGSTKVAYRVEQKSS